MKKIAAILALLLYYTIYTNNEMSKDKQANIEETKMTYAIPSEDFPHEGTWLTWPHSYTYGVEYQNELEDIWIQMTQALHIAEKVHIVAYNKKEQV